MVHCQSLGEKSWEIKGSNQQMAAMMLMLINLTIHSFHPGFLRPHDFSQLGYFCVNFTSFCTLYGPKTMQPMADFEVFVSSFQYRHDDDY